MSEIFTIKQIACETCVHGDTCSHRIDLPGIARICDLFVDRTLPEDIRAEIRAGARCHVCAAPAISCGGGARVTCGACLLAQTAAKRQLGDKVVKVFRASFTAAAAPAPIPTEGCGGADPDEAEEEA